MSGGVGFTQYATAAYTDDVLDDFTYYGKDYVEDKYGGLTEAPNNMDTVLDVGSEVSFYALEQYEEYPALLETHFGGSQRASVISAAAGCSTAFATGNAQTGLSAWYLGMYLHKEQHSMRGPNYPNYAMNVGHQGEYAGIAQAPHAARGDAWSFNPLVKIAFADKNLVFDFSKPREEFAKGALREFEPSGERTVITPAK